MLYPALFLMMAYALSVGNAGTGFRYRTHLVLLGLSALVVLREHGLQRASEESREAAGAGQDKSALSVGRAQWPPNALPHRAAQAAGTLRPRA
jgi:hypothetical protein